MANAIHEVQHEVKNKIYNEVNNEVNNLDYSDYRNVGVVFRRNGSDFLICYNKAGLLALNIDEILSFYEVYNKEQTNDIITHGSLIADNLENYIHNRGGSIETIRFN